MESGNCEIAELRNQGIAKTEKKNHGIAKPRNYKFTDVYYPRGPIGFGKRNLRIVEMNLKTKLKLETKYRNRYRNREIEIEIAKLKSRNRGIAKLKSQDRRIAKSRII